MGTSVVTTITAQRIAEAERCCDPHAAWSWVRCIAELALAGHIEAIVLANAIGHALEAEHLGHARPLRNIP